MKKFNALAMLFVICFTFSCKEKEETVEPASQKPDYKPETTFGTHYDATNSGAVAWDQLPKELTSAIPLDAANVKTTSNGRTEAAIYSFQYGPFGGTGGASFVMFPPKYSRIYAMAIRSGTLIDRLVVWYRRSDGTIYSSGAGGPGGVYHLQLFASDEYIYYISGRSSVAVTRLSVFTNKKSFTYGGTGGSPFYAQVPNGYQHLGFWGRSSTRIDQIGFYVYQR